MKLNIDQLKAIDLVNFCEQCYGFQFQRQGNVFVSLSPFKKETNPSFVIHQNNGHWLFKDFSSGRGGSIIDLVRVLENLPHDFPTIVARIKTLLGKQLKASISTASRHSSASRRPAGQSDLSYVFDKIRANDVEKARAYLRSRAISEKVIADLVKNDQLFTNVYNGKTFCCFAVRDIQQKIVCLDNHQINGPNKFVLGSKHVFVSDYNALEKADEVVITEGIIDLLSMQTLFSSVGLALLGNAMHFPAELIGSSKKLVLALDNDDAGDIGKQKLRARFTNKIIVDFSVGDYKDPNELLIALPNIATKRKKYTLQQKSGLYKQCQHCQNKLALKK